MIKIRHRGAPGYEPENTLLSFKKALELNAKMIELDVQLCKTGELIVIHDYSVDRTTNGQGKVKYFSFKDLRKFNVGEKQKIPLLTEVIDLVNKKIPLNIELKGKNTAEPTNKIIQDYINKGWKNEDFIISSFHHKELKRFYKLNNKIKLGILLENNLLDKLKLYFWVFGFAKRINADSINPSLNWVNKKLVEKIHKKNMKIFVWVVNETEDIQKMKELKVDGIFTDFLERV